MSGGHVTKTLYNNDNIQYNYEFTESKDVKRRILIIDNNGYNHDFIVANTLVHVRIVQTADDVEALKQLELDDYTINEDSSYVPVRIKKTLYKVLQSICG